MLSSHHFPVRGVLKSHQQSPVEARFVARRARHKRREYVPSPASPVDVDSLARSWTSFQTQYTGSCVGHLSDKNLDVEKERQREAGKRFVPLISGLLRGLFPYASQSPTLPAFNLVNRACCNQGTQRAFQARLAQTRYLELQAFRTTKLRDRQNVEISAWADHLASKLMIHRCSDDDRVAGWDEPWTYLRNQRGRAWTF